MCGPQPYGKSNFTGNRGPGVPGPYKYCDFVWNFFGSFFVKKEQNPR